MAKQLKDKGVNLNVNEKNEYENGNNALHAACFLSGNQAMAKWLLDVCKIDKETKGRKQRTPFLCAAEYGNLKIAKLLKERGANIHAKNKDGKNALKLTPSYEKEMISYLESLGLR